MAETRAELDEDIEELFRLARELGVEEGDGFFSDNERIEHRSASTAVQPPSIPFSLLRVVLLRVRGMSTFAKLTNKSS